MIEKYLLNFGMMKNVKIFQYFTLTTFSLNLCFYFIKNIFIMAYV